MATNAKRKKGVRQLSVVLDAAGKQFPFTLCHRELALGPETVQYYWMDSRYLRELHGEGIQNFGSCVGLWWWRTMQAGLSSDPIQQEHLLLANAYSVVSGSKSLQHILRDAYLRPPPKKWGSAEDQEQTAGPLTLSDEDHARIREVVESHNRHLIKQELDQALELFVEPDNERYFLSWMYEGFLDHGRHLMRGHLLEGLNRFAVLLERFVKKWRRRGNAEFEHHFIDMLSYECKVSFYLTYANAWRSLIPWLAENEGIDARSQRLLRLWHNQYQPIELPPPADDPCAPSRRRDPRCSEPGIDYLPDIFSGQVLSLHPLSGIIMNDPAHFSVVGSFIGSPEYLQVMSTGQADNCQTYWRFLEVVLIAANRYRLMHQAAKSQRGHKTFGGNSTAQLAHDSAPLNLARLFEDYTSVRQLKCACGGRLQFGGKFSLISDEAVEVFYRCQQCNSDKLCEIPRDHLISDLFG